MKISFVKALLKQYDDKKGSFRSLKDEPHIAKLRAFYNTLSGPDRDLTPTELYKLLLIGLDKKTSNGSTSCLVFDNLFSQLGGKESFQFLQDKKLLNAETVTSVYKMKGYMHLLDFIKLCDVYSLLDKELLHAISLFDKEIMACLYSIVSLLEKEDKRLINYQNLQSCLRFAATPKALTNLTYFFKALSVANQMNQKQLDSLFQHFSVIQKGCTYQRLLDFIVSANLNLCDYIDLIINNGGPEMGQALDKIEAISFRTEAQKELVFNTVLLYAQWHDRIFEGINRLTPANNGFFVLVVSNPAHANKIAEGIELLSSMLPHSQKVKEDFAANIKAAPHLADVLIQMIYMLNLNKLNNQKNLCELMSRNLNVTILNPVAQKLSDARLLNQNNLDLLLGIANDRGLQKIEAQCANLDKSHRLTQKAFEQLFIPNSVVEQYAQVDEEDLSDSLDPEYPTLNFAFLGGNDPDEEHDRFRFLG